MSLTCPPLPLGLTPAPRDPVSITTLPRLLTLLLSLTVPAVSHTLPPAAWALCQLLPTTAVLKACSEPRHTSCCCSSEVAHWEPQSCLSLGFSHHSQDNCAAGSRAGADGAALCSCLDQPWTWLPGGAWPLQLGSTPHPTWLPGGRGLCSWICPPPHPTPVLTASPRDYLGFPVLAPLPQVHWVRMRKVRDNLGADHRELPVEL